MLVNIKIQAKSFQLRHEIFSKLYVYIYIYIYVHSVSCLYTLLLLFGLASKVFPNAKYYVVCTGFLMGSKFYFPNGEFIFPNSSSLKNT